MRAWIAFLDPFVFAACYLRFLSGRARFEGKMPAVDVAMGRSLRRGVLDLLVASLRPAFDRRDIEGQITDFKTAFSSWDNCMKAAFCKWPVIALIIIGGLIIISVTWCIIRCACCGLSCCCSFFSCLKCCGNCCGCCDPPRGSRRQYLDEPYIPPHHGYKSQEPMHSGFGGGTIPATTKAADFPQFAEFDVGGKKNEDALPQMPSWEGAERKKVLVEEEAVEMNALKKPEAGAQVAAAGGLASAAGHSPTGPRSPVAQSPYGAPGSGPGSSGYFGVADHDPYAQGAPGFNQPGMTYGETDHGYGMAAGAMGRQSPHPYNNGGGYNAGYRNTGYGQQAHDYSTPAAQTTDPYDPTHPQPYDIYDHYASAPTDQPYGNQPAHEMNATTPYGAESRRSPAPQGQYGGGGYGQESRRSPAPQGRYGPGPDSRRSPNPQGPYGGGPDGRRGSPAPQGPYGSDPARRGSPAPQGPYGGPDARRSPAPRGPYGQGGTGPNSGYGGGLDSRRSPGPQGGGPGGNPRGGYGSASSASRAPPQRQYTSNSNNGATSPSGPAPGGFDFSSAGYSRPGPSGSPVNGAAAGGYRQPSPALEGRGGAGGAGGGGGGGGYPGYKPYQPTA